MDLLVNGKMKCNKDIWYGFKLDLSSWREKINYRRKKNYSIVFFIKFIFNDFSDWY